MDELADQAEAQEFGSPDLLGGVLLEHEAESDEHRGDDSRHDVYPAHGPRSRYS
jgi:hypothetical protein